MEKIVFEWHGYVLMEPIGFLFNWLISIQCFYHAYKFKAHSKRNKSVQLWMWFFMLFGGSTFFGGLSHLLFHYFDLSGKIPGWSLAILSMTFLELAVLTQSGKSRFLWLVWLQTLIVFVLLGIDFKFLWVSIQTIVGLVLVLGIMSLFEIRKGDTAWNGYLKGIGFMLISLPFVIGKIDLSIWFNRHDVSHVFMMLCLWQFYKASQAILIK